MVNFTQYVPPYGNTRLVSLCLDRSYEEKAADIIDAGYRFTVERLSTGDVSMCITCEECDVCIEICNEQDVKSSAKLLIDSFSLEKAEQMRKELGDDGY